MPAGFRHIVTAICLTALADSALPHHSIAPFDTDETLSLSATVVEYEWANPHVYIQVEAPDESGQATLWMIEAGPPNLMARSGWSGDSLRAGDIVTADVHPMRNGRAGIALGNSVTKSDGTFLPIRETAVVSELSTPADAAPVATDDIFGRWIAVWDPALAGRFLAPANGWSVNQAGQDAIASYDDSANPSQDCNFEKPPFAMIWPSVREIEPDGTSVRLRFELQPDRVIHLEMDDHDGAEYSADGHSIGRFEGTTLIVDTTHFAEHRRGLGLGLPSSREKHLVERFELSDSGTEVLYSFTVEDPVYLTEPMEGAIRFQHRPDLALESIECDPDIAKRYIDY